MCSSDLEEKRKIRCFTTKSDYTKESVDKNHHLGDYPLRWLFLYSNPKELINITYEAKNNDKFMLKYFLGA